MRLTDDGPISTDVGSSNGTTVAGARLLPYQPLPLIDGLVIQIGPFSLTYRAPQAANRGNVADAAPLVQKAPAASPPPRRPTSPVPLARGPVSQYLRDLPVLFESDGDNDFPGRFLLIFESRWER